MAIDKWSQVGNGKESYGAWSIEWNKGNEYVKVWRTGLSAAEMKRRGKPGRYIVSISGNKKYFKTKAEALKYAKRYMGIY